MRVLPRRAEDAAIAAETGRFLNHHHEKYVMAANLAAVTASLLLSAAPGGDKIQIVDAVAEEQPTGTAGE